MEAMEVDASVLAYSLLSGGEEGEVHSSDELIPESALQALFSANAAVKGVVGGDEQAPREALTLHPAVPLEMCRPWRTWLSEPSTLDHLPERRMSEELCQAISPWQTTTFLSTE